MDSAVSEKTGSLELYDLLEEFMSMLRKGQSIPVREFAKRHPDHADDIVAHFPALLMAEGLMPRLSNSSSSTPNAECAKPPELLAGYRVLRQIGKGGMGVVYQAEHPQLTRKLAVKILLGYKGKLKISERFKREAEAVSRLNHPNIVPVFDFGEQSGVQYLVMPLVEGFSLDLLFEANRKADQSSVDATAIASRIIGPTADFKMLARLGADVASALTHAHENNTIHRDIKPGNLILDGDGKIWVTDFGLAKIRDDGSDLSRTGDVIGTPRFMAPEQMRGLCDERSDVYSLGVTLYEMASGTKAWDHPTSAQLLKARATVELPELDECAPHVPKPLADIIMKACSFRAEDRYESAKELQVVLNRFAHGQKTGDRRRRSRSEGSTFHRKRTVAGLLVLIPTITLITMYFLQAGPWANELASQEAYLSLVQDENQRDKVVEQLPEIIDAALTSTDEGVREKASDLTLKMFEQALDKTDADDEEKAMQLDRVKRASDAFRKRGFQYSEFQHPLSNAVRNMDLAQQVSSLEINALTMLTCKFRIAHLGELIRHNRMLDSEIASLLAQLPPEAQRQPTDEPLREASLIRFLHIIDRVFARLGENTDTSKHSGSAEALLDLVNNGIRSSSGGGGRKVTTEDLLNLPEDVKRKFLEAAAAKKRAKSGR